MAKSENGLTQKQEAFCAAYVVTGNATEAYKRSYSAARMKPESIRVNAAKLLATTNISLRIRELQQQAAQLAVISAADVLVEIKRLALSDPRNIMHPDGRVKMLHELDGPTAASISSFEVDEKGAIKYKFWDKNAALEKAAKHLGMYERDNQQKADPLASLLHAIGNGNGNGFKPLTLDPEKPQAKAQPSAFTPRPDDERD